MGSVILAISLVGAAIAGVMANQALQRQREAQVGTRIEQTGVEALRLSETREIEALLLAIQAGQELKDIVKDGRPLEKYPALSPLLALQQILYKIHEQNQVGLQPQLRGFSLSSDGKQMATVSDHW